MAKKVNIIIQENGTIGFSFDGFDGDSCFDEANEIKSRLKELGVEVSVMDVESKSSDNAPKIKQRRKIEERH